MKGNLLWIVAAAGLALVGCNKAESPAEVQHDVSEARADASRDVACVQGGLHHLSALPEDLESTVAEVSRVLRVGGRFTHRTVRFDGGIILGMTSRDPSFGFTAGVTWVFRGFSVP